MSKNNKEVNKPRTLWIDKDGLVCISNPRIKGDGSIGKLS